MKIRILLLLASLLIACSGFAQSLYPFTLRAPAEWAGESLGGVAGGFGSGTYLGTFELSGGSAAIPVPFSLNPNFYFYAKVGVGSSFAIIDHAALQAAMPNSGLLDLNFQPAPGTIPVLRVLLSSDRSGHSFALIQQMPDGTVLSTAMTWGGTVQGEENGETVMYDRASATYDPALPFWVMDLTALELAPMNTVQPGAASWTPDARRYPLRSVVIFFDPAEAGHRFTVHSQMGNGPEMRTSGAPGYVSSFMDPFLDVAVAEGASFWVTREADGWSSQVTTGTPWVASDANMQSLIGSGDGDGWSALGMFPDPPQRTGLVTKRFRVHNDNRGAHSFSVCLSDGYSTAFVPSYASDSIGSWDDEGVSNPLTLSIFDAQVDPHHSWWLRDDTTGENFPIGQTDVLDGWMPQHPGAPPAPVLTLRLPGWRDPANINIAPSPNDSDTNLAAWGVSSSGFGPIQGVDGMAPYSLFTTTITIQNSHPYQTQFLLQDALTGEVTQFYGPDGDLRRWLPPPQSISLSISTSRSGHRLVLRHPNGRGYPIFEGATQGTSWLSPGGGSATVPYYYFQATANHHPQLPRYVEDLDTGERIGADPTAADLITWIAVKTPTNLTARADAAGITLDWLPGNAAVYGGYIIERRESMNTNGPFTFWHEIKRVPIGQTTWQDIQLVPGEYAIYRVRAFFGNGANERRSAPSNRARAVMWIDHDSNGTPDGPPDGGDDGTDEDHTDLDPPGDGEDDDDGPGNPGIPGDGDGDGDPDNDKDGVVDTNDSYPDDKKRSEDIPVKFYGVIDLSKYEYQGEPVKADNVTMMAIDDENNVSWLNAGELIQTSGGTAGTFDDSWIENNQEFTITKWKDGEVADTSTLSFHTRSDSHWNEQTFSRETTETVDRYEVKMINGSGLSVGGHQESYVGGAGGIGRATLRTFPGDFAVPNSFLQPQVPPWVPPYNYYNYIENSLLVGMEYRCVSSGSGTPAMKAGVVSYVVTDGGSDRQVTKCFRDAGAAREYFSEDGGEPILVSDTAVVIKFPGNGSTVSPRSVLWDAGTTTTAISITDGVPDPRAINNSNQVVGAIVREPSVERDERGELGFLWSPTDGMKVFNDLLPEKFRKQLTSAVPYFISNVDPDDGAASILFTADNWEATETGDDWVARQFMARWEDNEITHIETIESHAEVVLDPKMTTPRGTVAATILNPDGLAPGLGLVVQFVPRVPERTHWGFDPWMRGDKKWEQGDGWTPHIDLPLKETWTSLSRGGAFALNQKLAIVFRSQSDAESCELYVPDASKPFIDVPTMAAVSTWRAMTISGKSSQAPTIETPEVWVLPRGRKAKLPAPTEKDCVGRLKVMAMPARTIKVGIWRAAGLPEGVPTDKQIIDKMIEIYKQACISVVQTHSGTLASTDWDADGDGFFSPYGSDRNPFLANTTMVAKLNIAILPKVRENLNGIALGANRAAVFAGSFKPPRQDMTDLPYTCAHEVGHMLTISTRKTKPNGLDQGIGHDGTGNDSVDRPGAGEGIYPDLMWTTDTDQLLIDGRVATPGFYKNYKAAMETATNFWEPSLMRPGGGKRNWLRHEDWKQANEKAIDFR